MRVGRKLWGIGIALAALCAVALAADFEWDWRNQQTIERTDTSLGNTSKLTEPERTQLIDDIVLRLEKPLREAGYEDDRIREIASTTRLRFEELGDGNPVILAMSIGIEGGCDELFNCPFWIFRHEKDGYVSLLDTVAATYTVQPTSTNGMPDLVILQHITRSVNRLSVYSFDKSKYGDAGCYMAKFPETKEASALQEPEITPCAKPAGSQ